MIRESVISSYPSQVMVDWAWLKTVQTIEQVLHFKSRKYELGACISLFNLCLSFSDWKVGLDKSSSIAETLE